jgi:hypothetical protein
MQRGNIKNLEIYLDNRGKRFKKKLFWSNPSKPKKRQINFTHHCPFINHSLSINRKYIHIFFFVNFSSVGEMTPTVPSQAGGIGVTTWLHSGVVSNTNLVEPAKGYIFSKFIHF